MKKLTIWGMVLLVLYIIVFYIPHNLSYYSVYYATNILHREETNPVLVMVANNMHVIKLPEDNYELVKPGGFGGPSTLTRKRNPFMGIVILARGIYVSKVENTIIFSQNDGSYMEDYTYEQGGGNRIPMEISQRNQFMENLDSFLSDIVAVQEKPSINLQWLFNSLNESRFN